MILFEQLFLSALRPAIYHYLSIASSIVFKKGNLGSMVSQMPAIDFLLLKSQ